MKSVLLFRVSNTKVKPAERAWTEGKRQKCLINDPECNNNDIVQGRMMIHVLTSMCARSTKRAGKRNRIENAKKVLLL